MHDSFQRPVNYLRVSVTDRCNLRCVYCMPPEGVPLMLHEDILSYEEICTVVRAAAQLGINKVRLTGGEPLVRGGVPELVEMIAGIGTIDDISLTTNGILLAGLAARLKAAGLNRVNISLDTLRPERFERITRRPGFEAVFEGIDAAREAGLDPVKINVVLMAGVNDDELLDFAAKTIHDGWHVRFIEYMPVSGQDDRKKFLPIDEAKTRLETLGKLEPSRTAAGNGPAKYFRYPGAKGTVGFITPISEHFCFQCNRLRLTADGKLRPCLMSDEEIDLRWALRHEASPNGLRELIETAIARKPRQHRLAEGYVFDDRPFSQVGG
jgi:cyclic pyranopterin phosphate synthase